jgi:tRNA threonylcarbamoyl adenosine modification protein YeaZ
MKRYTLAIESAVGGGSIALVADGDAKFSRTGTAGVSKAEDLLPEIDILLKEASVTFDDIDLIAVSVGPGSFTGLRIGLSTAMGLSDATGIKTVGVSALASLASVYGTDTAVVPISRNDVAWQIFSADETDIKVGPVEEFLASDASRRAVHSSLYEKHKEAFDDRFAAELVVCENIASAVGIFAQTRPETRLPLEPIYVQNPRYLAVF